MSTIDLTRHATDFRKHYAGVRLQQGRVLTDDDFNEAARIDQEDMRRTRVHVIGAAGSPDGGFLITPVLTTTGLPDLTIGAGTLYLGGLRLEMRPAETYRLQRDWLRRPPGADIAVPAPGTSRHDLVWVEAVVQPVSAVEDGELFEIALSGPDTSMRVRTMRRVFVQQNVGNVPCPQAWSSLVASWAASGGLNEELEFTTDATLTVDLNPVPGLPGDLCSPGGVPGYLGAENQAIRVQLVDAGHFVWGFDNAAPLYRVEVETDAQNDRRVIHMLTEPRDQAHWPLVDQWVELLPWSAALPNGETVAERSGHLARVDGSYNPDTQRFTLAIADEVPPAFGQEGQAAGATYLYMRVWNRGADTTPLPIGFAPGTPQPLETTGLRVTINGAQRRAEDFWIIAARPESPNRVVPWQLETGRPPHGDRRFRAPLAIVRWTNTGGVVEGTRIDDCRDPFLPLTRIRSCCTYTVGDGVSSQGHFTSIQAAIEALPPEGGEVCVLPGTYTGSVLIQGRRNVTLHGCGPRSRVQAPPGAGGAPAAPVLRIASSAVITVERLALVAQPTAPGIRVDATPLSQDLRLAALHISAGPRSAIEIPAGRRITIADCTIRQNDAPGPWPAVFSAADDVRIVGNSVEVVPTTPPTGGAPSVQAGRGGVQLGGGSERVRVLDNVIRGGIGNGITLGSLQVVGPAGGVVDEPWVVDADDPCSPCKPGDVHVPPGGGGGGRPTVRSAGTLYEIVIEHNRILDMGLNGIGVVAFFHPDDSEVITVEGLTIVRNEIVGCLRRSLALIPSGMLSFMGYGGIALAACEDLVIVDNLIEDNGPDHLQPVCGVYVLLGVGVELASNRILNTGAKTTEPATSARPGSRAGIHIQFARAPRFPTRLARRFRRTTGVPAVKVHDNVVMQPLGRALAVGALGPVSVQDNRLVSHGFVPGSPDALATTVVILNLGVSNEVPPRHLFSLLDGFIGQLDGKGTETLSLSCAEALRIEDDDILAGVAWPSGKVLFTGNQCTLDLMDDTAGFALALSSIAILTADDVGFLDNQCECDLTLQFVLTHALLAGMTVRAGGNRWSEGWRHAFLSAVTIGVLNATTNNQSTHCLLVSALRTDLRVATGNVALLEAFCPALCRRRD
jgi:hypothetical protein